MFKPAKSIPASRFNTTDATAPQSAAAVASRVHVFGEIQMSHDAERDRKRYAEDSEYRERRRAIGRAYRQRNKEKIKASRREKYATDPDYQAKQLARARAYKLDNRDSINARFRERYATDPEFREKTLSRERGRLTERRAKRYGLAEQEYHAILSRQGGACAICARSFTRTPCVDHCHITGLVRGLLCRRCNLGLGHFEDNPDLAYSAGAYLERWLENLLDVCDIEENDVTSNDDAAEEGEAARMIRTAILHELRQPFGVEPPPAADWLQALARALVAKAGQSDLQALKEVFDRAGGTMSSARATSVPKQLMLSWKGPARAAKRKAATKNRTGKSAPSTTGGSARTVSSAAPVRPSRA